MMDKETFNNIKNEYPKCCFLLFGDPLQFEPPNGGKPLNNDDFDYVIEFNVPHRFMKDAALIWFLEGLKRGEVNKKFILGRERNPMGELIIPYEKKSLSLNEKAKDWHIGNHYKTTRTFIDNNGHFYTDRQFRNNEIWRVEDFDGEMVTMKSCGRSKEVKVLINSQEAMHFEKANIVNGHLVQGDTFDEKTKVHCTFEGNEGVVKHNGTRHLYVACSRVRTESQISFAKGTAELFENVKYKPLTSGVIPNVSGNNDEFIKMIKLSNVVTFLGGKLPTIYSSQLDLEKVTINSLVLGNKQNSLITQKFGHKMELKRARDKVDSELSKLLPVHIPNKESNQPVFIHKNSPDSYKNIVLEIDELPKEEQLKLLHQHRKLIYRAIWSGRESVHFWFRVENANKDNYKQIAACLDRQLFNGQCCVFKNQPAHSLVRAPNVIRPSTGELQEIIFNKRNIITVQLPEIQEPVQPESTRFSAFDNSVEYYFNLCKNDHDGKNGGRGELILAKTFKQQREHNWDNGQCRQLIELLCREWKCTDKIGRLQSYFN